jgi:DNA repair protein RadC
VAVSDPGPRAPCTTLPSAGASGNGSSPMSAVRAVSRDGVDGASDVEVVAALLAGADGPEAAGAAARRLLERFETLRRVASATPQEIQRAALVPEAAALRLAAAFSLGRRSAAGRVEKGDAFRSSREIYERYHPLLRDSRRERFVEVMLDGKNRVMREERISEGSLTSSLVHPREVFAPAIRESAGALIFVHNHPSGDPEPSPDDFEITERLASVGVLVGIPVLDHVVVGDGAFVSFLDRGLLERP